MRSRRFHGLAAGFIIGAGPLLALSNAALGAPPDVGNRDQTLIVDQARGTLMQARTGKPGNGTPGRPFASIGECAAAARPGTTCLIRSGIYRETVTPDTSGEPGRPIRFTAAPDATAIVSGADIVEGWRPATGMVWAARIKLAPDYSETVNPTNEDIAANQIFKDGAPQPEAQWPEPNGSGYLTESRGQIEAIITGAGTNTGTYRVAGGLPGNLGDLTGAHIYWTGAWTATSGTVTGSNAAAGTFSATQPPSQVYVYPALQPPGSRNFVLTGLRQFLNQPGEWFYDAAAGELLYWSLGGIRPRAIEAKTRNYAFDLAGVSDIEIKGLQIFAATIRVRPDAARVTIDGIRARYVTHSRSVQYDQALWRSNVYQSRRLDSGIQLLGSDSIIKNSVIQWSSASGVAVAGSGNTVDNNVITDINYGGSYAAPVALARNVVNATISGNTLARSGRDGINVNGSPQDGLPFVTGVRITRNDISQFGMLTNDVGGIYVCCAWSGPWQDSRIDRNRIHRSSAPGTVIGLYLDNGTFASGQTGLIVDHNVVWDLPTGIFNNPTNGPNTGERISVVNNTIVAPALASFGVNPPSLLVRNNIFEGGLQGRAGLGPNDRNLVGPADPLFRDRETADFRLVPGSPWLGGGLAVPGITAAGGGPVEVGAFEGPAWQAGSSLQPDGGLR